MSKRRRGANVDEAERARIRLLVEERGERGAAEELGLDHRTVARALAGLPVYPGTRSLIRERLHGVKVA